MWGKTTTAAAAPFPGGDDTNEWITVKWEHKWEKTLIIAAFFCLFTKNLRVTWREREGESDRNKKAKIYTIVVNFTISKKVGSIKTNELGSNEDDVKHVKKRHSTGNVLKFGQL